jgi:hypothetical protein
VKHKIKYNKLTYFFFCLLKLLLDRDGDLDGAREESADGVGQDLLESVWRIDQFCAQSKEQNLIGDNFKFKNNASNGFMVRLHRRVLLVVIKIMIKFIFVWGEFLKAKLAPTQQPGAYAAPRRQLSRAPPLRRCQLAPRHEFTSMREFTPRTSLKSSPRMLSDEI